MFSPSCARKVSLVSEKGKIIVTWAGNHRVIEISKSEGITSITENDTAVLIKFSDQFKDSLDQLWFFSNTYFEIDLLDVNNKSEIKLYSQSIHQSVRNRNEKEPFIWYNEEEKTFFPDTTITINRVCFDSSLW